MDGKLNNGELGSQLMPAQPLSKQAMPLRGLTHVPHPPWAFITIIITATAPPPTIFIATTTTVK